MFEHKLAQLLNKTCPKAEEQKKKFGLNPHPENIEGVKELLKSAIPKLAIYYLKHT